jgi:hypothetical protein
LAVSLVISKEIITLFDPSSKCKTLRPHTPSPYIIMNKQKDCISGPIHLCKALIYLWHRGSCILTYLPKAKINQAQSLNYSTTETAATTVTL